MMLRVGKTFQEASDFVLQDMATWNERMAKEAKSSPKKEGDAGKGGRGRGRGKTWTRTQTWQWQQQWQGDKWQSQGRAPWRSRETSNQE